MLELLLAPALPGPFTTRAFRVTSGDLYLQLLWLRRTSANSVATTGKDLAKEATVQVLEVSRVGP